MIKMTILNLIVNLLALQDVEMADTFRAEGKIYVVVAVVAVVLVIILFYLWTLDRKISKLEKDIKNQ